MSDDEKKLRDTIGLWPPYMYKREAEEQDWQELTDYIESQRKEAVKEYKLQTAIERLDVQCSEGNCKNCDSKRPLLKKLQAQLKELTKGGNIE